LALLVRQVSLRLLEQAQELVRELVRAWRRLQARGLALLVRQVSLRLLEQAQEQVLA
jgi:hypothetical protein